MNKKIIKVALITIAVLAFMMIAGNNYMYKNGLSGKYENTLAKEGQIKVACVGDSITYGHGISNWSKNCYPALLQNLLGDTYHVSNFGSSGACVNPDGDQAYEKREIYKSALQYDADIVVIMMGTNDSKPENWTNVEDFISDYSALIETFTKGEKAPKVYLALPSEAFYTDDEEKKTGITTYDIQPAKIDEMVVALKEYAQNNEVITGIIDIHTLTEAHSEWFEIDGVHPNNDGAKEIAQAVANTIKELE